MNFFIRYLVRIRKEYNKRAKRLYLVSGGAALLFSLASFGIDFVLPYEGWGNIVRSVFLVPVSLALYTFLYAVSLFFHYAKQAGDPDWQPYRMRWSPSWRLRMSAVIIALMFVLVYANGFRPGYTFTSSLFVVVVITCIAFCRRTRDEIIRDNLGIPDTRDIEYNARLKESKRAREKKRAQKAKNKKNDSEEEKDS